MALTISQKLKTKNYIPNNNKVDLIQLLSHVTSLHDNSNFDNLLQKLLGRQYIFNSLFSLYYEYLLHIILFIFLIFKPVLAVKMEQQKTFMFLEMLTFNERQSILLEIGDLLTTVSFYFLYYLWYILFDIY